MAELLANKDLCKFAEGLDELESLLKKIQPFLPVATGLLQNLRRFRETVSEIQEALDDSQEDLEEIRGALGISEDSHDAIQNALDELPNFDENELEEIERALKFVITLDGPNIFAQRALEQVEYILRSPKAK
jgi:hypothetical protein